MERQLEDSARCWEEDPSSLEEDPSNRADLEEGSPCCSEQPCTQAALMMLLVADSLTEEVQQLQGRQR